MPFLLEEKWEIEGHSIGLIAEKYKFVRRKAQELMEWETADGSEPIEIRQFVKKAQADAIFLDSNIMRTRRKLLIVDETRDKIIWDLKCEIMSFDKIQNIFISDRIKRNAKSIERYVWILNTNFVNKYCQISEFGDLKWNDCTGEKEKWMRWA